MANGRSSARFVGRDRELSRIAVALEAAASGRSRRLVVTGPGGVGVSRLIDESARRVGRLSQPFAVLRWRAHAGRSLDPYGPLIDGLRAFREDLDEQERLRIFEPAADALSMLLPEMSVGAAPTAGLHVGRDRRAARVAEALLGVLERAAERQPVLLVLEDLHLADAATRAAAIFLAQITRPGRICMISTFESDRLVTDSAVEADLAAITDAADQADRLRLEPLGRDELAQLIAGIEGQRPTAALLLLTYERSDGNPLLAEEVLAARRALEGVSLSTSLARLVAAQLAIRSSECRRVLSLLASVQMPISRETLQSIATADAATTGELPERSSSRPRHGADGLDADVQAGVAEALEHGFLVEHPDQTFEIRHDLIARAIEAELLPIERRRHHGVLITTLGSVPGARAKHALAAHQTDLAREAFLELADVAADRGAEVDRLEALEQAMELGATEVASGVAAGRFLLLAANVAAAAGRNDRAARYLEAASREFGEREDAAILASVHDRLGKAERTLGHHDRALAEHRRAASMVPADSPLLRAQVLGSLAQTLMLLGTFGEAESVAADAIAAARDAGPDGLAAEGHATCTLGIVRAWGARPAEAIDLLEQARDIARKVDDADDFFRAVLNLTTALTLLRRGPEAIAVTDEAIERARRYGLEAVYGNALRGNVAEALFLTGRWAEAQASIRTALEWSPTADAFADAAVTAAMLEVESASGERASRLLGRRLLELRTETDPQAVVPASRSAASFAMWRRDLEDAARAAELGWTAVQGTEDWVLALRMAATYLEVQAMVVADAQERRVVAEIVAARQRTPVVLAEAERVLATSGVPAETVTRREAEAQLATARAFAARIEGRDVAAVWDVVARTWESVGDPYQVARSRWRQAETALTGVDARAGRTAARAPLLEAVRIARELGAQPLLRELESLARRALISLPPGHDEHARPAENTQPRSAARQGLAPVSMDLSAAGATNESDVMAPAGHRIVEDFVGPPEPRPDEAFGLSNREREVLGLIVQGRTNREIGERLFISQKTVGVHVGNILSKLGVSGRVEAAMIAVRLDLLPSRAR
ncbi:MAG: AAA family ATPase [Chloroflexota bacterium]